MIKRDIFLITIIFISIGFQLSLMQGYDWFQYSRTDIESGQWWRIVTGNLIHLNWRHFAMNTIALIAIYYLFPRILKTIDLFLVFLFCCICVTFGLWLFNPSVFWYVGLSGALHGLLIVLVVLDYLESRKILTLVLLLIILAKLLWEFIWGPLPGSESTAGGRVITQAHIYGAIGGVILVNVLILEKYIKNKKLKE